MKVKMTRSKGNNRGNNTLEEARVYVDGFLDTSSL